MSQTRAHFVLNMVEQESVACDGRQYFGSRDTGIIYFPLKGSRVFVTLRMHAYMYDFVRATLFHYDTKKLNV